MTMIDLLLLPAPSLLAMVMLGVACFQLDRLPVDDFVQRRFLMKVAAFNLSVVVVFMGVTIYNVPRLLAMIH